MSLRRKALRFSALPGLEQDRNPYVNNAAYCAAWFEATCGAMRLRLIGTLPIAGHARIIPGISNAPTVALNNRIQ